MQAEIWRLKNRPKLAGLPSEPLIAQAERRGLQNGPKLAGLPSEPLATQTERRRLQNRPELAGLPSEPLTTQAERRRMQNRPKLAGLPSEPLTAQVESWRLQNRPKLAWPQLASVRRLTGSTSHRITQMHADNAMRVDSVGGSDLFRAYKWTWTVAKAIEDSARDGRTRNK